MNIIKDINKDKIVYNETNQIIVKSYGHFYFNNSIGNCKHCVINNIGHCIYFYKNDTFEILDKLFNEVKKLCFTVNVTEYGYIEKLSEHFKLINCQAIPIGYGTGYQYHAIFFTNYYNYNGRSTYIKRVEEENKQLKNKENSKLKEILLKIKNYKMDFYRNKFIDKLLKDI